MDGDAGRQVELAVAVTFHPDDEERFAGDGVNPNTIVACQKRSSVVIVVVVCNTEKNKR